MKYYKNDTVDSRQLFHKIKQGKRYGSNKYKYLNIGIRSSNSNDLNQVILFIIRLKPKDKWKEIKFGENNQIKFDQILHFFFALNMQNL